MVRENVGSHLDPCRPMRSKESVIQMCMDLMTLSVAATDIGQTWYGSVMLTSGTRQWCLSTVVSSSYKLRLTYCKVCCMILRPVSMSA